MYTNVNGVRLAYNDRGRRHSPALLLIHGFPLDRHLWDAQLRGLSRRFRVIAPDLRGHGTSEVVLGPYTMDQHADDLAALLTHLGIQRAIVVGLSMGGYVAFAFWRRHAERVGALVLADTRAEPDSVLARVNRDAAAARVQEIGVAAFVEEMLPKLLAPANLTNQRVVKAGRTIMARQPLSGIVGALGGLRDRADSRPTLPTITVPTLVLTGEADALTPPADGAAMAAGIPNARAVVLSKAGHLSPLENPRAFNAALRKFVGAVILSRQSPPEEASDGDIKPKAIR